MRIALTGNPNSGKTTMYNALTGRNERVGNWAGVTVDKKEHPIKKAYYAGNEQLVAVDLPGAYSMSPFTSEESITSSYVRKENPDVIINIVDATNLSRSLFFTTQLLELGIPVVVALNKSDINEKKETKIDEAALSETLGCPVIKTVSTSADGLKAVVEAAVARANTTQKAPYSQENIDLTDKKVVEEADRKRFEYVNKIVKKVENRKILTKDKNVGDKIDSVLTNKWLGIPIFAVVMWLVFQISQAWVGPLIADMLVAWLETFIAKENVVGTLAVCFVGLENLIDTEELAMMEGAGAEVAGVIAITKVAALAYLMFNLYTPPCFAAIGAMNSEMKSAKWLWGGIGLQLGVGYTIGYLVYTIGTLITAPELLNMGAVIAGLIAVVIMAGIVVVLINNTNKQLKAEYALSR